MTRLLRIGLTGGIASGKSTVAERFRELGVPVIDADEAARAVVAPGTPGLAAVVERFGAGIVAGSGELDRRSLRERIFSDTGARRDLESILHPLIRAEMERRAAASQGPYVVMAIPLLVEGGSRGRPTGSRPTGVPAAGVPAAGEPAAGVPAAGVPAAGEPVARARVDRVLVIDVDESLQLQRVMARDGSTLEQARAILASQASRSERLAAADDVVLNSGTVPELRHEVDHLHEIYLRLAATRDSAKT